MNRFLKLSLCLIFVFPGLGSAKTHFSSFSVSLVDCYDGDTCTLNIKGLPSKYKILGQGIKVRLLGMDTPEIKGLCAKETKLAKAARSRLLRRLKSARGLRLELASFKDVYGRHMGKLYFDGVNAADYMLRQRHRGEPLAHKRRGKDRYSWCR